MIALGWAIIALCGLGMVASVVAWALTECQERRWEAMRQEVRDALAFDPSELAGSFYLTRDDMEHEAMLSSIVICEKHRTVSPDYCASCRIDDIVALTQPGHVVHS